MSATRSENSMATITTQTLEVQRAEYAGAIAQIDGDIKNLSASLENKRLNRIATDGALQAIEALIKRSAEPDPKETS